MLDPDHVDHSTAREWLSAEIRQGWASCALTENGFVRILSQLRYPSPVSPSEAAARLRRATSTEHHELWPCSLSFLDPERIDADRVHGPRQVTDVVSGAPGEIAADLTAFAAARLPEAWVPRLIERLDAIPSRRSKPAHLPPAGSSVTIAFASLPDERGPGRDLRAGRFPGGSAWPSSVSTW